MSRREYVRLVRGYLCSADTTDGMKWLGNALEWDSDCQPAHRTLVEQAIAAHRWAEAKDHLEIFLQYAPAEDPAEYSSLAGVNVALGDLRFARAALKKGVRIFPGDANLWRLVAQTPSVPHEGPNRRFTVGLGGPPRSSP